MTGDEPEAAARQDGNGRRIGGMPLPRSILARQVLGWSLIAGGIFGFLPVLGFWMVPLGLGVLSVDSPWARRRRRKLVVWWNRWRRKGVSRD